MARGHEQYAQHRLRHGAAQRPIAVAIVADSSELTAELAQLIHSSTPLRLLGACGPGSREPQAQIKRADVIILAVTSGPCVTRERLRFILDQVPKAHVLAVVDRPEAALCSECLRLVRGVISKPLRAETLTKAVATVHDGGPHLWQRPTATAGISEPESCVRPDLAASLTPRELEILALQAQGHAYKHIAAELGLSERTVTNHLFSIHQKLGVHNAIEAINLVFPRDRQVSD